MHSLISKLEMFLIALVLNYFDMFIEVYIRNIKTINAWKHQTLCVISYAASKHLLEAEVRGWRCPEALG